MQKNKIVESLKSGNIVELNMPWETLFARRKVKDEFYLLPSKECKVIFLGEECLDYEKPFLKFLHCNNILYLYKFWCENHFSIKTIKIIKS